ncbi:hypothetical protein DFJ73DRAFT_537466 [Zopfochytrium polystomum]|nr:hypothetical protein DFJ73DRAFT_537466 [Zopfochytrium polystomum]
MPLACPFPGCIRSFRSIPALSQHLQTKQHAAEIIPDTAAICKDCSTSLAGNTGTQYAQHISAHTRAYNPQHKGIKKASGRKQGATAEIPTAVTAAAAAAAAALGSAGQFSYADFSALMGEEGPAFEAAASLFSALHSNTATQAPAARPEDASATEYDIQRYRHEIQLRDALLAEKDAIISGFIEFAEFMIAEDEDNREELLARVPAYPYLSHFTAAAAPTSSASATSNSASPPA